MKLVFIRHTSVAVAPGVCYGQSDVPLAPTFETEAAEVLRRLAPYKFDRVCCSPLSRCRRLAAYCGYESPQIDSRLMEMNFGEWEMKRYDEITDPRLELWYADFVNVRATGGESSMEQRARLTDFINELKNTAAADETVAIFTHGGIVIHALATLAGMTDTEAFAAQPGYGAIVEIDI